jgi:hypothetical protein
VPTQDSDKARGGKQLPEIHNAGNVLSAGPLSKLRAPANRAINAGIQGGFFLGPLPAFVSGFFRKCAVMEG